MIRHYEWTEPYGQWSFCRLSFPILPWLKPKERSWTGCFQNRTLIFCTPKYQCITVAISSAITTHHCFRTSITFTVSDLKEKREKQASKLLDDINLHRRVYHAPEHVMLVSQPLVPVKNRDYQKYRKLATGTSQTLEHGTRDT